MSKTLAKLYLYAISNNKITVANKLQILQDLSIFPVKTVKALQKHFKLELVDLELMCDELFSKFDSWIVIGCPLSTDLDVVCIVNSEFKSNGQTFPLLTTEIERLKQELRISGYEQKINLLDLNVVTIYNGNITSLTKGGRETQNIIMDTYKYHTQKYPSIYPFL